MMKQSPPELFTQRPVRSDFGRKSDRMINVRKLVFLLSVASIVAISGYAAYHFYLAERPQIPAGEIPVIRAEGDVKTRPDDPGGLEVPHQDVLVFEQLDKDAQETASGAAEHLLPPPETPASPLQEQVNAGVPEAATDLPPLHEGQSEALLPAPVPVQSVLPLKHEKLISNAKTVVSAPAKEEKVEAVKEKLADASSSVEAADSAITTTVGSVEKTVEPSRLPESIFKDGSSSETKKVTVPVKSVPSKKKGIQIISGKMVKVQLGSFSEEQAAEKAIKIIEKKHAAIVKDVSLSVVRADLGAKGIYYRIMSDPLGEEEAKTICSSLASRKAACMIAR